MKLTDERRKELRITLDYTNMTDKYLGGKGISEKTISAHKKLAKNAHAYVNSNRGKDELFMGWTELPYNQSEIVGEGHPQKLRRLCRARNRRLCARPLHGIQCPLPPAL